MSPLVVAGWVGTALSLGAHVYAGAASHARVPGYYLANFVAASLSAAASVHFGTVAAVFVAVFWAAVSLAALLGIAQPAIAPRAHLLAVPLAVATLSGLLAWPVAGLSVAAEILGWTGAAAFCGGYLMFASGRCSRSVYFAFNLFAPLAMLPVLVLDRNWPVVALESSWTALSVAGLVADIRRRATGAGD